MATFLPSVFSISFPFTPTTTTLTLSPSNPSPLHNLSVHWRVNRQSRLQVSSCPSFSDASLLLNAFVFFCLRRLFLSIPFLSWLSFSWSLYRRQDQWEYKRLTERKDWQIIQEWMLKSSLVLTSSLFCHHHHLLLNSNFLFSNFCSLILSLGVRQTVTGFRTVSRTKGTKNEHLFRGRSKQKTLNVVNDRTGLFVGPKLCVKKDKIWLERSYKRREQREQREESVTQDHPITKKVSRTKFWLWRRILVSIFLSHGFWSLSSCFLIAFRQLLLDFEDTLFYAELSTPPVFQALCLLVLRQNFVRVSLEIIFIVERFVSIIFYIPLIRGNFLCHLKEYPVQPLVCQDSGPRVDPQSWVTLLRVVLTILRVSISIILCLPLKISWINLYSHLHTSIFNKNLRIFTELETQSSRRD